MVSTVTQGFFFVALIVATLWFGKVLGPQSQPETKPASQSAHEVGAKPDATTVNNDLEITALGGDLEAPLPDQSADKAAEFSPGAQAPALPWLPVLAAALIFGFGSYRVMRKLREADPEDTAAVVDDSEPFSRALKVWNPLIASQLETPRELRRFMNRLRYSAVRLNGMAADSAFENSLSEEEIVSLAALYLLDPACIELCAEVDSADEFLSRVDLTGQGKFAHEGRLLLTEGQFEALKGAIHNYTADEGVSAWGFDNNKINIFKVLLQGVKVH